MSIPIMLKQLFPIIMRQMIVNKETRDTDHNGADDRIILTFSKEVFDFEAGDFYITDENGRSYWCYPSYER